MSLNENAVEENVFISMHMLLPALSKVSSKQAECMDGTEKQVDACSGGLGAAEGPVFSVKKKRQLFKIRNSG